MWGQSEYFVYTRLLENLKGYPYRIDGLDNVLIDDICIGTAKFIADLTPEKAKSFAKKRLEEGKRHMAYEQQEVSERRARAAGRDAGEFFVALNGNVPPFRAFKFAGQLAKMAGFMDTDSNDAYKEEFVNCYLNYQSANSGSRITQPNPERLAINKPDMFNENS